MSQPAAAPAPRAPQPLLHRIFWFGVGGLMSVALNLGPFAWLRTHGGLRDGVALAISLSVVTVVFAIWNYYVNFRTSSSFKECQVRYLTAVGLCYAFTYSLAMFGMKKSGAGGWWDYAIVAAAQIFTAGFKFLLYNYWVYPRKVPADPEKAVAALS